MRDLTKWPRLLVVGEPVTPEVADELIVRTTLWWLSSNDRDWLRAVYALVGIEVEDHGIPSRADLGRVERELRVLPLGCLTNERIASSWIGGPHGWCDWDGTIGCANYNVGKWPGVDELTAEWTAIAAAFPMLNLSAQAIPDEGAAERPAVGWQVAGGRVAVVDEPTTLLTDPARPDYDRWAAALSLSRSGRERGVTLDRLERALDRARDRTS